MVIIAALLGIIVIFLGLKCHVYYKLIKAQRALIAEQGKAMKVADEIIKTMEKGIESRDKLIDVQDDYMKKMRSVTTIPGRPDEK